MNSIPLIESSFAYLFAKYLDDTGFPVRKWLRAALLPASLVDNPSGYVSEFHLRQFIEDAARSSKIDDLGLKVADTVSMEELGDLADQMQKQPDLIASLRLFCDRVVDVNSHARFWICRNGGYSWFCRSNPRELENAQYFAEQFTVAYMIKLVQMILGSDWLPGRVHLQTSITRSYALCATFSNADIRYQQKVTAFTIPADIDMADTPLEPLSAEAMPESLSAGLAKLLYPYLPEKCLSVAQAATLVRLTERTLKRRLRGENTSYRELVLKVRLETACELLTSTDKSMIDVAIAVGYTSPGNFSRAFQRWSGITPTQYRSRTRKVSKRDGR